MDWSKTKTIFIVVFLILDLFLAFQFVEKRNSSKLGIITETTLEEQLDENDITYVDLPNETIKETYITGKSKEFTEEEVLTLKNQLILGTSTTKNLVIQFETPIPISSDSADWLSFFVKTNMIQGDSYVYWGYEEQSNVILFFQQYKGKTLYQNPNAFLAIYLNDQKEMIGYKQALLEDIEEMMVEGNKQEILPAIKAIETMYVKNELKPGSKVTKVDLGYFSLLKDAQVFVPTWHIIVNNQDNFYVNAFEGQIIRDITQWSEEE